MSRRNKPQKRVPLPDPIFNSEDVARFINRLMRRGKKSIAERIFYNSLNIIKEKIKDEPIEVFQKALKNVTPLIEVKARRIGGSTYQVPLEVRPDRGIALGSTWLIDTAKAKTGKPMEEKLAQELISAYNGEGAAVKKREDTHKMAEANKAFAHYRY
ncbi:MAG: 30S ribosomal protein S7 [Candidatus Melainabacteria bacterium GWA2_34_9]|nr:MAG: 30S ribosomal protein S7 [Candidatus Melainabacteria bacterium GWA2_34_9]